MSKSGDKIRAFVQRLLDDTGLSVSDVVVLSSGRYSDRLEYRLKANQTLPFFIVELHDWSIDLDIGTTDEDSKRFQLDRIDGKVDEELYAALLPLIRKCLDKAYAKLMSQIKYAGPDGTVVVRKGLGNGETDLWYYTKGGKELTATKFKDGTVNIRLFPKAHAKRFLSYVFVYLIEEKADA